MLHIIQSNQMDVLAKKCTELLNVAPLASIFCKEQVLVQSPGMAQWLSLEVSKTLGICAQTEFVLPASYIWRLYQALLPNVPEKSAFNKPNMAWKLYQLLPNLLAEPEFSVLANYLNNDDSGVKLFNLCDKIADVYDQYLMYRPAWLEAFEAGKNTLEELPNSETAWQATLWRALVSHTQSLGQSDYHRANLYQRLMQQLALGEQDVAARIGHNKLFIFGISAMPKQQLALFAALAEHIDVFLFFCNPSEHYWGDLVDEKTKAKIELKYSLKPALAHNIDTYYSVGNPLLSSWGKLGRDYLEQLLELDAKWHDLFEPPHNISLLSHIQREIFDLSFKGEVFSGDPLWYVSEEGKREVSLDGSVQFASCHSALREVEALHDHLLNLFENDPNLTPNDVIVMIPDVGSYSPYIQAVFGQTKGNLAIPFAISDLSIEQENPILNSFKALTQLYRSRFNVSELIDLLQVPAIAKRFAIELSDIDTIGHWLEEVKIRWGINQQHKQQLNSYGFELNTWRHGLNRLLLGAISSDDQMPFNGVYGKAQIEGADMVLLGNLIAFFDSLVHHKEILTHDATLAEKVALHQTMIGAFFDAQDQQSWELLKISDMLSALLKHYDNNDYQGQISQALMVNLVAQGLKNKGVGQRFLAGQVNFCSLMPMRAVPFKVVCMLGLNDGDFPRTVQPVGFDLLHKAPRQKGDRSRKLDERYLFLEAVLSAKAHLYMSYIGNSCLDNSERMPSTLVSELQEYIERTCTIASASTKLVPALTRTHYLQPFNPAYYQAGELQSYNPIWSEQHEASQVAEAVGEITVEHIDELEIKELIYALTNSYKYFYRTSLAIALPEFTEINRDEEPFTVNPLVSYQILDNLLGASIEQRQPNSEQILQSGDLPQGALGKLAFAKLTERISVMAQHVSSYVHDLPEPRLVKLRVNETLLVGQFEKLNQGTLVFYRPASIKAKDHISGFIYHLVGSALGDVTQTYVFGLDNYISFKPIERSTALGLLGDYLNLFNTIRSKPTALLPVAGFNYLETDDMAKTEAKFLPNQFHGMGESEDPYIRLSVSSLYQVEDEFIALTTKYLVPIKEYCEAHDYA